MRRALAALGLTVIGTVATAAVDVDALWNFADPAASEARFREALASANGDDALVRIARHAYRTYGRGNHPAGLNFGNCFAYALAKTTGLPLLFKGDDFAQTDLTPGI